MTSSVSYRGYYESNAGGSVSSVTITGADIGSAASDRFVTLALWLSYIDIGHGVPNVTIGGISATARVSRLDDTFGNTTATVIYTAPVPSGTTANIVITPDTGSTQETYAAGVWAIYGVQASPTSTASDGANVYTLSQNVSSGSVFIGFAGASGFSAPTFTWSGATEDFDGAFAGSNSAFSGASHRATGSESPRTFTATASSVFAEVAGGVGVVFAERSDVSLVTTEDSDTLSSSVTVVTQASLTVTEAPDTLLAVVEQTYSLVFTATEASDTLLASLETHNLLTLAGIEEADVCTMFSQVLYTEQSLGFFDFR